MTIWKDPYWRERETPPSIGHGSISQLPITETEAAKVIKRPLGFAPPKLPPKPSPKRKRKTTNAKEAA